MGKPVDLLLLAAHCDDGELWAGGTIARLVESGKRVVLGIAHHDSVRRREAEAGAAILGCETWYRKKQTKLLEWASTCLNAACPEVLMTHQIGDPHFEHHELGEVVRKALTKSSHRKTYPRRWYWLDTYYSTQSPGTPVLIDISAHFARKCSALDCHDSQTPSALIEMAQTMNALHGQRIRAEYAEAFYPFALLGRWPKLRELP
jgi:LmbE family N-acetylglucosaminyl deacetylase